MWDVFISHASEDKEQIARPLAVELQRRGLQVWFDEFSLTLGDSLRRSIDQGLAVSRFGIVILSQSFFAKEWPQKELDGLAAREAMGGKILLPVWHGVSYADVAKSSPLLADRLAVSSERGITSVADAIEAVVREQRNTNPAKLPNSRQTEQALHTWRKLITAVQETPADIDRGQSTTQRPNRRLQIGARFAWRGSLLAMALAASVYFVRRNSEQVPSGGVQPSAVDHQDTGIVRKNSELDQSGGPKQPDAGENRNASIVPQYSELDQSGGVKQSTATESQNTSNVSNSAVTTNRVFTLSSENSRFATKSTIEGEYSVSSSFLEVQVHRGTMTWRSQGAFNYTRTIRAMRVGIAEDLPGGGFQLIRFGEWIALNKQIAAAETFALAPARILIPITGLDDLSSYWLVAEVLETSGPDPSRVGASYAHSAERLLGGAPTNH